MVSEPGALHICYFFLHTRPYYLIVSVDTLLALVRLLVSRCKPVQSVP